MGKWTWKLVKKDLLLKKSSVICGWPLMKAPKNQEPPRKMLSRWSNKFLQRDSHPCLSIFKKEFDESDCLFVYGNPEKWLLSQCELTYSISNRDPSVFVEIPKFANLH